MKLATVSKKKYKIEIDELPLVSDVTAMYNYINTVKVDLNFLKYLDSIIGLNDTVLSKWLNITTRTMHNYKTKSVVDLKDNTKEQIVLLLALYKHGSNVFNSTEKFEEWLKAKNILLGNKSPLDYLNTATGVQFIDRRLTAIEFGENV